MADARDRIRVVLRWIQILDTKEPFFKKAGQFFFEATVSTGDSGRTVKTRLPEKGHLTVSESFSQNRVEFDTVLFEGEAGGPVVVDIHGEEVDRFSRNDPLPPYRREFGSTAEALGWYGPGDETPGQDPENLGAWRVCYIIEKV